MLYGWVNSAMHNYTTIRVRQYWYHYQDIIKRLPLTMVITPYSNCPPNIGHFNPIIYIISNPRQSKSLMKIHTD